SNLKNFIPHNLTKDEIFNHLPSSCIILCRLCGIARNSLLDITWETFLSEVDPIDSETEVVVKVCKYGSSEIVRHLEKCQFSSGHHPLKLDDSWTELSKRYIIVLEVECEHNGYRGTSEGFTVI
ncbi:13973_t:CDS:2, partial [Acaulospora morrowiae]